MYHWSTIEQKHSYLSLCQIYKIVNLLDCINFFSPCKAPQMRYCKVNSLQCMPSCVNAFQYLLKHILFGIHWRYTFLLHLHMLHSNPLFCPSVLYTLTLCFNFLYVPCYCLPFACFFLMFEEHTS